MGRSKKLFGKARKVRPSQDELRIEQFDEAIEGVGFELSHASRHLGMIEALRGAQLDPTMLPIAMLQEMMGREYFVRVAPAPELETELLIRSESTPAIKLGDQRRMRAVA